MSFTHQHTFLRSALVKDPFSLGDLGPEDVLRIESEFPNLFDSATPETIVDEPKSKHSTSKVPVTKIESKKRVPSSTSIHKCCDCVTSNPLTAKKIGSPLPLNKRLSISKLMTSKAETTRSTKTVENPSYEKRPGQSLSVIDLKRILEEILWQKDLTLYQQHQDQLRGSLQNMNKLDPLEVKQSLQCECPNSNFLSTTGTKLMKTFIETDKPYNQRLCIAPNARKSRPVAVTQNVEKKAIGPSGSKSLAHEKRNEFKQDTFTTANRIKDPKKVSSNSHRNSGGVTAPGYLRPTIMANNSLVRPCSKPKKSVQFSKETKIKDESVEMNQIKDTTRTRSDNVTGLIVSNKDCHEKEIPEKLEAESKHVTLKGLGKTEEFETDDAYQFSGESASYEQLKLVKSLAKKYEKNGLLNKKKSKKYSSEKSIKRTSRKDSLPDAPIANYTEYHHRDHAPVVQIPPSPNMLQNLAKELVFVEVIKHLHELQDQEQQRHKNQDINEDQESNKRMFSSGCEPELLDKFNCTSEVCDVTRMSTPDLTPSSSSPQKSVNKARVGVLSKCQEQDISSPSSPPNLTSSILIKNNPSILNESLVNNNDNTDCSEISDFIFSEKELKVTAKNRPNIYNLVKSESLISTPRLTSKCQDFAHVGQADESQDSKNSPNTLNVTSITSIFDFTISENPANQNDNKKKESVEKTRSNYLNPKPLACVTEELLGTGISNSDDRNSESELRNSTIQKLHCDTLSEGEYIGNFYRSPGEISISNPQTTCLLAGTSSPSMFVSEGVHSSFPQLIHANQDLSTGEYLTIR